MQKRMINPWTWQDQFGFVQANEITGAQRYLICSGQTSVDDNGVPVNIGDMAGQINKAVDNLEIVLKQAGFSMSDVVRLNYYTTDVDGFLEAAEVAGRRLAESECHAASTLLGVSRLAFPELLVEIEATAVA
jgi:enamine deaminase RidA (YjgF/YER057c/UK114 family)